MRHLALVPALLLCAAVQGQDRPDESKARYGALLQQFEAANKEWSMAYRKAKDDAARQKLLEERPNTVFAAKFLEAAQKEEGDDAVPFLVWVVGNGYGADTDQRMALELLVKNHVKHPDMKDVASQLRFIAGTVGKDITRKALDAIVDENPDQEAVANALFARATMNQRRGEMSAEDIEAACADLARVLEMEVGAGTKSRAEGALFEYRNLRIGMTAPDIEGEDLDGVPFKLSDYRGKVVVLDFWGDW